MSPIMAGAEIKTDIVYVCVSEKMEAEFPALIPVYDPHIPSDEQGKFPGD